MKPLVLLGAAGTIGRVIAWDWLGSSPAHKILLADLDAARLKTLSRRLGPRSRAVELDLHDAKKLVSVLKSGALVINSTSHHFNLPVMRAALAAGCHYLDLGGLFHFTRRQLRLHREFADTGLTAVLGMGCAPGLTNLMARELTSGWEEVKSVDIRVGGVDHQPDPEAVPYAFRTLREELTLRPALFDHGKWKYTVPQGGRETYSFPDPVGPQSVFYTLHSEVATLPVFLKDRSIQRVSFRIGLDPALCRRILKERRPSPQSPAPSGSTESEEMACVEAIGTCRGRPIQGRMICETRSDGPWSAGDLNTGCPASATAALMLEKSSFAPGVYAPENVVPWHPLQRSLLKRAFRFVQETASL